MFRTRVHVAVLMLLLAAATASAASNASQIDGLLKKYNRLRQFNGSALVADHGVVIHKKGYGYADFEWQIPNTPDTKFRLGSITKQFTSMVIMQLVADGKIKLDDKLAALLPEYRQDTGARVTVEHLLTHTSGIPSYTSLPGFRQNVARNPYRVDDFVKQFASGDLQFEPGSKYAYSNSGYFLLGAIIERVTGKPYEKVLQERIFDPIGMKSSGYDHSETVLARRARGYTVEPSGYHNADYLDMSIPYAAGSLYSTVEDLQLWDRALYADGLLPPALKTKMFTPALDDYAFGWIVRKMKLQDGRTEVLTISHSGGINGFSSFLVRIPGEQQLVVLLDNTSGGAKLEEIARGIISILHGIEAQDPKPSLADEVAASFEKKGVSAAVAQYRELKATQSDKYSLNENELNRLGLQLLEQGRITDAIEILKLNVEAFPDRFNPYDSLGEAYLARGDRELAIKNYKKSVELNPQNTNGLEALKKLEGH